MKRLSRACSFTDLPALEHHNSFGEHSELHAREAWYFFFPACLGNGETKPWWRFPGLEIVCDCTSSVWPSAFGNAKWEELIEAHFPGMWEIASFLRLLLGKTHIPQASSHFHSIASFCVILIIIFKNPKPHPLFAASFLLKGLCHVQSYVIPTVGQCYCICVAVTRQSGIYRMSGCTAAALCENLVWNIRLALSLLKREVSQRVGHSFRRQTFQFLGKVCRGWQR